MGDITTMDDEDLDGVFDDDIYIEATDSEQENPDVIAEEVVEEEGSADEVVQKLRAQIEVMQNVIDDYRTKLTESQRESEQLRLEINTLKIKQAEKFKYEEDPDELKEEEDDVVVDFQAFTEVSEEIIPIRVPVPKCSNTWYKQWMPDANATIRIKRKKKKRRKSRGRHRN